MVSDVASVEGTPIGNMYGFFGDAIRQGWSMRKFATEFRKPRAEGGMGGRIGNQELRSGYAAVRKALLDHPTVSSLPGGAEPGLQHYQPWQAGEAGRFAHQALLHIWDPVSQIGYDREWTVMSSGPMSPDDFTQYAIDEWNDNIDAEGPQGPARAIAATPTGLYRTV